MHLPAPLAILDVACTGSATGVGCVLADTWIARHPTDQITRRFTSAPARYAPGPLYRRELPSLRAVIEGLRPPPAVLVIDSYVWLGADGAPGLGAHLFAGLGSMVPVVGIAKNLYHGDTWSERVLRGASRKPLYVTAAGIETARAAEAVLQMYGNQRIPTLLQQACILSRTALALPES